MTVLWVVLAVLWLPSLPGFAVTVAGVGEAPRGFVPGCGLAILGWASFPVTAVLAAVGVGPWWLPLVSVGALPGGYLLGLVGAGAASRRGSPGPSSPSPPGSGAA